VLVSKDGNDTERKNTEHNISKTPFFPLFARKNYTYFRSTRQRTTVNQHLGQTAQTWEAMVGPVVRKTVLLHLTNERYRGWPSNSGVK
jgi:hypothetical protein